MLQGVRNKNEDDAIRLLCVTYFKIKETKWGAFLSSFLADTRGVLNVAFKANNENYW